MNFIKPDWRKIILFIVLFTISLSLKSSFGIGELYWRARGFPWPILVYEDGLFLNLIYWGLILDLIFWYLISCLIIWIYDKFKKKSH